MAFERFEPGPKTSRSQKKWRILYVEDEDINWEVTQLALKDHHHIERAKTDFEAFSVLRRNIYDLILMDIQLSGSKLNGIEITRVLKQVDGAPAPSYAQGIDARDTPVVFVTAYTARYTRAELLQAGGNEAAYKPVDFVRLQLVIARLLVKHIP